LGRKLREQEEIVEQMTDEIVSKQKTLDEKESLIESLQQKLKDKGNESVLSKESEEKECNICYYPFDSEDHKAMVFLPCGHARFCKKCYHKLQGRKKLCPIDRIEIKKAELVFF